jgi:site-specific DNA-methyltransferase (adenine-specific)
VTPYGLAAWWCKYTLPPGGVLLDPFCGSGTMLLAGLDHGASRVIGIDRVAKYLRIARKRVEEGVTPPPSLHVKAPGVLDL